MSLHRLKSIALLLLLVSGCASPSAEDYASNTPTMDIRTYFNGPVEAWGMFVDRSGKADPLFHVNMMGRWEGTTGTLQEHFTYNDGHTQDRLWTMVFTDDHHFTGTASDVIGVAPGEQYGNAAHMNYILPVTTHDGSTYDMSMDDWIYLMSDTTALNRNEMSKLGLNVGELIITFQKQPISPASRKK